jgi:CxxC motif-containing protein (DUF1111 family)
MSIRVAAVRGELRSDRGLSFLIRPQRRAVSRFPYPGFQGGAIVFRIANRTARVKLYGLTALSGMALGLVGVTQSPAFQDAPTGFNTPSFTPLQSVSNGFPEPTGDTFAIDQQEFEKNETIQDGLGPVYNATACVTCHQNQGSGGAGQMTEIRVGHNNASGMFVNPTIMVEGGPVVARSIVNDRAICPQAQEHVPETENIRTLRAVLNTLGDGFVEAIDDDTLKDIAQKQKERTNGRVHGEAIEVPIFEASGMTRVGRFGWKDQHGSLLSFAADAYLNEMGITNRLRPTDATQVCKTTSDPEDQPDSNGQADIDHFALFLRGTMAPPRDATLMTTQGALHGEHIFHEIGCETCHVKTIRTAAPGTSFAGGTFTVPDALGNKIIHPFGDFLLHDIGTGDGIVQTTGLQETANEMRTAPLWGLRTKTRFMHDLKSLSLESAIERHRGEASDARDQFRFLSAGDRQDLITFLNSL